MRVLCGLVLLPCSGLFQFPIAAGQESRAAGPAVQVERLRSAGGEILVARNRFLAPVTVSAELVAPSNALACWEWGAGGSAVVVMPGTAALLGRVGPRDRNSPWSFEYRFHYAHGDMHARQDTAVLYRLPLRAASLCLQGFGGPFSHTGRDYHSIDLRCPVGTPVHAARAGLVIETKADSRRGGADASLREEANFVRILHADGTIGNYLHFRLDGIRVEVGQRVAAGDLLGSSGNTGFSSEPHLHFGVIRADPRCRWRSLSFHFAGRDGRPFIPRAGEVVPSGH